MVSTWQMGKHLRLNTFREIFLAANALDNISSLCSTSGKGKCCGTWERGVPKTFSQMIWCFGYLTTQRQKSEIRGWLKRTRCPQPRGAIGKDCRVSKMEKLKVYPVQTDHFMNGETEVQGWSGHSNCWTGTEQLFEPGLLALWLVFPLHRDASGNNGGIQNKGISFMVQVAVRAPHGRNLRPMGTEQKMGLTQGFITYIPTFFTFINSGPNPKREWIN